MPAFKIRNILFQFKYTGHKLRTMYLFLKKDFFRNFKDYWCTKSKTLTTKQHQI